MSLSHLPRKLDCVCRWLPGLGSTQEFFSLVMLQKQHTLRAHKQDCVLNFDLCDVVPLVALGSLKSTDKTEAL